MPRPWLLRKPQEMLTKVALISAGVLGVSVIGALSLRAATGQANAASYFHGASVEASQSHPLVYFGSARRTLVASLSENHSEFSLPLIGGSNHFSIRAISATEGRATWIFPDSVSAGTAARLWEYPNVLPPFSTNDRRFQIGRGSVRHSHGLDVVSVVFALPPRWPDIHASFMMEIEPRATFPLDSPPVGQLPEVPWDAGLPVLGLAAGGYALRRVSTRASRSI